MAGSQLYGVELDSITGRIASLPSRPGSLCAGLKGTLSKQLFDGSRQRAFDSTFNDPAYNKLGFHIHNYFFAKALDQVRPGGIMALLTSRYTLDAKDEKVRRYLAQRAELLGAVRLACPTMRHANRRDGKWFRHHLPAKSGTTSSTLCRTGCGPVRRRASPSTTISQRTRDGIGRAASESTHYGHQDYTVRPIEGADLAQQLHEAVGASTAKS